MDAKPHRPLRSFKVRDENAPINAFPVKTLHQRNKSSPALSMLAQHQVPINGVTKPAVKRTAFADVSNTTRGNNNAVKDDSVISVAKPAIESLRQTTVGEDGKAAPLLRPAQRPISVAGIRGFFNSFSTASTLTTQKPLPLEPAIDSTAAETNPLKTRTKRSTTVFKDTNILPPAPLEPIVTYPQSYDHIINVPSATDVAVGARTASQSQSRPVTADSAKSYLLDHQLPPLPPSSDHDIRSDGARLHSSHSQVSELQEHPHQVPEVYEDALPYAALEADRARRPAKPVAPTLPEPIVAHVPPKVETAYWEEEAQYDEEGYTTARSLKSLSNSRGDYTTQTGSTTVVLAPKVTAKVQRELDAARLFILESGTADNMEDEESWDTSMVSEYSDEIFSYMQKLEERMRPNPYYMDSQTEVQWSMRSVLMDWLVQVHHRFSLLPETLFLCVNYIDRFLSSKVVSLGKLQLVGATAIFVAAKYEEINCPSVSEIQYMVDGGYTVDEILKAERFMLSMLQFELGWPGPMSFLRRISKADDYDLETRTLAKYFLEVTIMDERFVGSIPSFTAAGAHCLARLMLKKGSWSQAHVYYSGYTYGQLRPLLQAILSCCDDPSKHHGAVFEKYGDKRFKRASFFVQSEVNKGFILPSLGRGGSIETGCDRLWANAGVDAGIDHIWKDGYEKEWQSIDDGWMAGEGLIDLEGSAVAPGFL